MYKHKVMKYVILGGAGHISKPIALQLLAAGHEVTVIGRSAENLSTLVTKGAKAAIGSINDKDFLVQTFRGADAVYTMVPPTMEAEDWKGYFAEVGRKYATAIREADVSHVVNLSSIGAHNRDGCGPVSGLFRVEEALNSLEGVNILHLRPAYFYYNFLASIPMVKGMQIIGSNFGHETFSLAISDTSDIATEAARALLDLDFKGHSYRYLYSDERTTSEIAAVIGEAIGNKNLPWVAFTDEQMLDGLLAAGLPSEIASNYTEMGSAIRSGKLQEDFQLNRPSVSGKVKLEDFARQFKEAYEA